VLDIYQPDSPDYWQAYADYFGNPPFVWGVLDTANFMQDYAVVGLGSVLVIDPAGRLVYRASTSPRSEYLAHLFVLADRTGAE
jgi:hypothetical protein